MSRRTLIIGGGISGLYAAHLLQARGESFTLVEAAPQVGGRIRSVLRDGVAVELGPSWFWPATNPRLARLIREQDLPDFAQYNEGDILIDDGRQLHRQPHRLSDPRDSRRLTNGSASLIDALLATLPTEAIHTGQVVQRVCQNGATITVNCDSPDGARDFTAERIVIAMPLRLMAASIQFEPVLPAAVVDAFRATPTWMAGEAKFIALYEEPFWRSQGLSGTAFGQTEGPLSECHDASHPAGGGGLLGFLDRTHPAANASPEEATAGCLKQLQHYFGAAAASPLESFLIDWSAEPLTATAQDKSLSSHPSYGLPKGAHELWDGQLRFAGTEAAPQFGGYLEGALEAAELALADW